MSGEQTFVPKLVNMFKISKLLVFEILDDFDTEVVINSQQKEGQEPNMKRSHESCQPEVYEWKIARTLSFL